MNIETIKMPKRKAQFEWKNYRLALIRRQDKYLKQIKSCLWHMSRGRKLLDIYEVMKKCGTNGDEEPKIAIAREDWEKVYFVKVNSTTGVFSGTDNGHMIHSDVALPSGTFKKWSTWSKEEVAQGKTQSWMEGRIRHDILSTKTPIIPATFLPKGNLSNYYILWEVDKWDEEPPKDPILLKRLSPNLFAVLAVWNLSKLERAIIRGRS
jgi:hypothetical protein